jgi:hypothetical protein
MAIISLTVYTNEFFSSVLKSPIQMGSLSINNSVTTLRVFSSEKELELKKNEKNTHFVARKYFYPQGKHICILTTVITVG